MFKMIGDVKVIKVGPSAAEKLLEINTMESQRKMKPHWKNTLVSMMKSGLFTKGDIAIARLHYSGKDVLANGQHVLNAIRDYGSAVTCVYAVYGCDTPDDLSSLFRQFDTHNMRNKSECVKVEVDANGLKWPQKISDMVATVGAINEGQQNARPVDKAVFIHRYIPLGAFLVKLLCDENGVRLKLKDYGFLFKSPIIYAMLLTLEKDKEDALRFWTQVRDGEGLSRSHSTYHLRNFLHNALNNRGRGANYSNSTSFDEYVTKCIHCWNYYRQGKYMTRLKVGVTSEYPKVR